MSDTKRIQDLDRDGLIKAMGSTPEDTYNLLMNLAAEMFAEAKEDRQACIALLGIMVQLGDRLR